MHVQTQWQYIYICILFYALEYWLMASVPLMPERGRFIGTAESYCPLSQIHIISNTVTNNAWVKADSKTEQIYHNG